MFGVHVHVFSTQGRSSLLYAEWLICTGQFAEDGRTRRDLTHAEPFFAPFSFNFLDMSGACTCHTLQTGLQGEPTVNTYSSFSRLLWHPDISREQPCVLPRRQHSHSSQGLNQDPLIQSPAQYSLGYHASTTTPDEFIKCLSSKMEAFSVSMMNVSDLVFLS